MRGKSPSRRVRTGAPRSTEALGLLAACFATLTGCGGNEGTPAPNIPPDTEITSSVPAEAGNIAHHLQILFRGLDADGTTVAFETLLHTYPRDVVSYDEIVVPKPVDNDPRWTRTESFFVDLVTLADTLRADPRGDIGDGHFDRWHTFFVRAIDNEGATDPDPAARTFNTFTLAPEMGLLVPQVGPTVPRSFAMRWDGSDDVGDGTIQDPQATRWVLLPLTPAEAADPVAVRNRLYDLPESAWSDWVAYGMEDSTREARLLDVVPPNTGDPFFVFSVQGLDDGGAVTPQFIEGTRSNYRVLQVLSNAPVGPIVPVRETRADLGDWRFEGETVTPVQVTATGVDSVSLSWGPMETAHYGFDGGKDYRFGWNLTDPNDDGQWTPWTTLRAAPPHALAVNPENFFLQARDPMGQVTEGRVIFFLR